MVFEDFIPTCACLRLANFFVTFKQCTKMPTPEVHACWPPKYVYGVLDLSVDHECGGGRERENQDFEFVDGLVTI